MTEKRFTSVYNEQLTMVQYVDTQKEEPNKWAIWNASETLQKLNQLNDENEQLKQFIQELTTKGTAKIHLANGSIYKVDAILSDFKGDME